MHILPDIIDADQPDNDLRNDSCYCCSQNRQKWNQNQVCEEVKNSKWEKWGLLAFVAIPLPGTGGWTGALVASLLNMKIKDSFPVIAVGVAIAGIIMAILSYGLPALF